MHAVILCAHCLHDVGGRVFLCCARKSKLVEKATRQHELRWQLGIY